MGSFALVQWVRLDWPTPDAVVPMPDSHSIGIGKAFACLLEIPFVRALRFDGSYKQDRLEEEKTVLLFDAFNRMEQLEKSSLSLLESFPKRIYVLRLVG